MTLHLQCVFLILGGALQTKILDASPSMNQKPSLHKVVLQPNFQDNQFQGKWYALGVADTTIQNGRKHQLTMYSVNYKLQRGHSFYVNTTKLRGKECEFSLLTLVQIWKPGEFTLNNFIRNGGILSYNMRVAATNYNQFAIVYVEKNVRFKWYFELTLYGRTKYLCPRLKKHFIKFAKSVGFAKNNIAFPVSIEECIDG